MTELGDGAVPFDDGGFSEEGLVVPDGNVPLELLDQRPQHNLGYNAWHMTLSPHRVRRLLHHWRDGRHGLHHVQSTHRCLEKEVHDAWSVLCDRDVNQRSRDVETTVEALELLGEVDKGLVTSALVSLACNPIGRPDVGDEGREGLEDKVLVEDVEVGDVSAVFWDLLDVGCDLVDAVTVVDKAVMARSVELVDHGTLKLCLHLVK